MQILLSLEQMQFNEKTVWTGSPAIRGAYQNFGDLFIEFQRHETYGDYRCQLCLDDAIGSVSHKIGKTTYVREYSYFWAIRTEPIKMAGANN